MAPTFQIIPTTLQKYTYAKICLLKSIETDQNWQKSATIPNIKSVIAIESVRMIKPAPIFKLSN